MHGVEGSIFEYTYMYVRTLLMLLDGGHLLVMR